MSYISTSLASRSITSPRLALLYRRSPPTLRAEYIGGTCLMGPMKCCSAACNVSSLMCCQSARWTTSVSASYDGVASPRRNVPLYSFRWAWKLSCHLVPFPTKTMSSPVAIGSNVPACPSFCRLIFVTDLTRPRSLAITSWEVHVFGLSIKKNPLRSCSTLSAAPLAIRAGGSASFAVVCLGSGLSELVADAEASGSLVLSRDWEAHDRWTRTDFPAVARRLC
mmetsp:Transcript_5809/g.21184  ORF Transcript_5809/g.21184 Transcript_5809/m.21184 type:complete len:223 (+) Transcript_5809:397-1065(+)